MGHGSHFSKSILFMALQRFLSPDHTAEQSFVESIICLNKILLHEQIFFLLTKSKEYVSIFTAILKSEDTNIPGRNNVEKIVKVFTCYKISPTLLMLFQLPNETSNHIRVQVSSFYLNTIKLIIY